MRRSLLVLLFSAMALPVFAATPPDAAEPQSPAATGANRPFEITDNSFLVEEAFNQEAGIFQNIFTMMRSQDGRWDGSYTQEWPVGSQRHQFSYTIPFAVVEGRRGAGDVMINYRYQAMEEHGRMPAFSPRLSVILPNGSQENGFGNGVVGWQLNLPFSKQFGHVYLHYNAGVTYSPGVQDYAASKEPGVSLVSPTTAASAIVRVRPMFNLMLEVVAASNESLVERAITECTRSLTVSPGFRGGWNVGPKQVIVGVAAPITFQAGGGRGAGLLTYVSYQLPWNQSSPPAAK